MSAAGGGVTTSSSTRAPASLFSHPSESAMREMARRAAEHGITVLDVREVDALSPEDRVAYLRRLHTWQFEQGIADGPYQEYRRWEQRCRHLIDEITGELCHRNRWESSPHCLQHSSLDEIDPNGAEERRRAAIRARTAKLAERALDRLEEMIEMNMEDIGPSAHIKAVTEALDRGGVPKRTETHQEISGEVHHTVDAASVIDERLDRLAPAPEESEEIVEAEVISVTSEETS